MAEFIHVEDTQTGENILLNINNIVAVIRATPATMEEHYPDQLLEAEGTVIVWETNEYTWESHIFIDSDEVIDLIVRNTSGI